MPDNGQNESENRRYGGGVFIAIGTVGGAMIGQQLGQTSIGVISGFVIGIGIALAIALRNQNHG